jgi:xylulokinase
MMALALHSRWMGAEVSTIYATGGAASSREILQVMADVFDAEVFQLQSGNSAALGAALRAFHADRMADGQPISWEEVVSGFAEPRPDSRIVPVRENVVIYRALIEEYAAREAQALRSPNTQ